MQLLAQHSLLTSFTIYDPVLPRSSRLTLQLISSTTALLMSAVFYSFRNGKLELTLSLALTGNWQTSVAGRCYYFICVNIFVWYYFMCIVILWCVRRAGSPSLSEEPLPQASASEIIVIAIITVAISLPLQKLFSILFSMVRSRVRNLFNGPRCIESI